MLLVLLLLLLLLVVLMELQDRSDQCFPERKGQKRKLEDEFEEEHRQISAAPTGDARDALLANVKEQVSILNSTFSWNESDRAAAKRATHALADLAKNGKSSPFPPSISSPVASFVSVFVELGHACASV